MSKNFKRIHKERETYIPKLKVKHKHNYLVKHLLIVTNINEHATANYYKKKEYYYVLKCDMCDSFIPQSLIGNYNGNIFDEKDVDYSLPIIKANTTDKCPHYSFSRLIDVEVMKNE